MATPVSAATFYGDLHHLVAVKEWGSWRTHNRGQRGTGWGPVNGIMIHHTVTKSTKSAIQSLYDGVEQPSGFLPGPLYHVAVDKQGTANLIGWGRANHAGLGDDDVLKAVIAEHYPLPKPNEANTDGNSRFYGIALLNLGDGKDPYPPAQLETAARAAALLCGLHDWTEKSVIGHKEWEPGKIDPSYSMSNFRSMVGARLRGPVKELLRHR